MLRILNQTSLKSPFPALASVGKKIDSFLSTKQNKLFQFSCRSGDTRIWTGEKGFAVPRLTTRPCRQNAIKKIYENTPPKKGGIFSYISYINIYWRHGRVVRRGTANPFSPVQIRVSPDRQEIWNIVLHFFIFIENFFSNRGNRGKRSLETW